MINKQQNAIIIHHSADIDGIRKLTPRECANFQGFPPDYLLPKIADSQLYKQLGNSVSIPVIERIAKKLQKAICD